MLSPFSGFDMFVKFCSLNLASQLGILVLGFWIDLISLTN